MQLSNASGNNMLRIKTDTGATFSDIAGSSNYLNQGSHPDGHSYYPPMEIPAGYTINIISSSVGVVAYGFCHGWIE